MREGLALGPGTWARLPAESRQLTIEAVPSVDVPILEAAGHVPNVAHAPDYAEAIIGIVRENEA